MSASTLNPVQQIAHPVIPRMREHLVDDLISSGYQEEKAVVLIYELEKFLQLCATSELAYRPSRQVDDAWHAFILRTADYAEYCDLLGGFIHHQPGEPSDVEATLGLRPTVEALLDAGLNPNLEVWANGQDGGCEAQCDPKCNVAPTPRF